MGSTIQVRNEAETGQYRVADTYYDKVGNPYFSTLSYFGSGSAFSPSVSTTRLGDYTEYDPIERPLRTTPGSQAAFGSSGQITSLTATGGDTDSHLGPTTMAYFDGTDPWTSVATDPEGKIHKLLNDSYGRTTNIIEVVNGTSQITGYTFDLVGNLKQITDNANNHTQMTYDTLGGTLTMSDPDMGLWRYALDNAGRLTQQTDARNNVIKVHYDDPGGLGRISSKQVYNSANQLTATTTYLYDSSDDPVNYPVFKGQLYKTVDSQGYERNAYDFRGRALKTSRYLTLNTIEYTIQRTFDDADRLQTLVYPENAATIQYTYDTGGNLYQVKSLGGTGTLLTFYTANGFNALGQPNGYTTGDGVETAYAYFEKSSRLQGLTTQQERC